MPTLSDIGRTGESPFERSLGRIQEQLNNMGSTVSQTRSQVTQNIQQVNSVVNTLEQGMTKLAEQVGLVATNLTKLNSASGQSRDNIRDNAATIDKAYETYRKMGVTVEKLGFQLEDLKLTEKELNKIVKLGTEYNEERADSYKSLSDRYRAMKIIYDNMTIAERQSNEAFVASMRSAYEEMNLIQQAAGKYQLQVGNYSKAMTGLNIAMTQVIREAPTLANSAATFAIAISNNIPILLDNIKAYQQSIAAQKAYRDELIADGKVLEASQVKITSLGKALVGTIFSWQTLIVGILTILPALFRKIDEHRKKQKELNGELEDTIKYEKLLKKAYSDTSKEMANATAKLETFYLVSQDLQRSMKERIQAGEALKLMYEEEFKNFTAEEIALGKAKTAYDELTKSLELQATVRAYLNKITSYKEQEIDIQAERDAAKVAYDNAKAERERADALLNRQIELGNTGESLTLYSQQLDKATKKEDDARAEFMKFDGQLQDLDNTIFKLRKEIPTQGILDELLGGRKSTAKDKITELKDYFEEFYKGILGQIANPRLREEALSAFDFDMQIEKYKQYLNEQRALSENEREIDARQEEYINGIIENLEIAKYQALLKIDETWAKKINDALRKANEKGIKDQEEDAKEMARLEEISFKSELAALSMELDTRDNIARETYKNDILYKKQLLSNEEWYWGQYLQIIARYGRWTAEEEKNVRANIERATSERGELRGVSVWDYIGIWTNTDIPKKAQTQLNKAFGYAFDYMDEWMDKRIEMAELAVELAEKEADAAKSALDYEMQARANGYANNVEFARREYEERLELQRKAVAEQERLEKIQERIDSAKQMSSLLVATANLLASYASLPIIGQAMSATAIASMWGMFTAAKIQASKVTKYGEGMSEYLDYGGSHASGHDIDFGTMKDGTRRRVERGEMIGVINKKNVNKYGVGQISSIIDSLNKGTFEEKYGMAFAGLGLSPTDLTNVEKGINTLVEQGSRRTMITPYGRVEYYGNNKRIIRN